MTRTQDSPTQTQVTFWRELPTMVVARSGPEPDAESVKAMLGPRFQEAVDEAAMRLGETSSDDYLAGWRRSEWVAASDPTADPRSVVDELTAGFDQEWPVDRIRAWLDDLGPTPAPDEGGPA